ncbi:hypothetical protein QFC24_005361 [Naganishia onofrii]|uniref:Uncharacterized protein n=1 Tax=Naganishia onofrii TaxID=1851511 RepID=A0ACC2XAM1_9TREE|nr:hypothetical protein QFC24_005361 [Naganishia onofrii]
MPEIEAEREVVPRDGAVASAVNGEGVDDAVFGIGVKDEEIVGESEDGPLSVTDGKISVVVNGESEDTAALVVVTRKEVVTEEGDANWVVKAGGTVPDDEVMIGGEPTSEEESEDDDVAEIEVKIGSKVVVASIAVARLGEREFPREEVGVVAVDGIADDKNVEVEEMTEASVVEVGMEEAKVESALGIRFQPFPNIISLGKSKEHKLRGVRTRIRKAIQKKRKQWWKGTIRQMSGIARIPPMLRKEEPMMTSRMAVRRRWMKRVLKR